MKFLQKLGKALMLPVAILPICGILMGIGYRLCPATMQGGDIQGAVNLIGLFLVKAGGALIDNMAILFAIGVGVGMSEKNDGTGGIAALASNYCRSCFYSCICCFIIRMAITFRSTCCYWKRNRWTGCCRSRYLCIPQSSAHSYRITSRTEQCILV